MTLFAFFRASTPIVISDVMLSEIRAPKVHVTPTGIVVEEIKGSRYQVSSYRQKALILADGRVLMTGSGIFSTLTMIASDLSSRISSGMTRHELASWLQSKSAICGSSTSVIVGWFDADGYVSAYVGTGIQEITLPHGGSAFCGGSGIDWFKRNLPRRGSEIKLTGNFHELEYVRFDAIGQTGQRLLQERIMGPRENFGGGFQIAYFNGSAIIPVQQILYIVLHVEHVSDGSRVMRLISPMIVQKWIGHRLTFELWSTNSSDFEKCDAGFLLEGKVAFKETEIRPLIYQSHQRCDVNKISTPEHVSVQVLHHRQGRVISVASFQLSGDPKLNPFRVDGTLDGPIRVQIEEETFHTWRETYKLFPNA